VIRTAIFATAFVVGGCDALLRLDTIGDQASCWGPSLTGNEDGDAWPDGCDTCPADPELEPRADRDGDGVGDACDPFPDLDGDMVVAFDGFDPMGTWNLEGGWTNDRGDLVSDLSLGSVAELIVPTSRNPTIDAIFDQVSLAGTAEAGVGLKLGAQEVEIRCSVRLSTGSPDELVISIDGAEITRVFDASGTVRLKLTRMPSGGARCSASKGSLTAQVGGMTPNIESRAAKVMLFASASPARFRSVTVFARR
jgi:hypothetical protein